MLAPTLSQFIATNRDALVSRCRERVAHRNDPPPTDLEIERGIPRFIDDIAGELSGGVSQRREMAERATQHGSDLFFEGFTVSQVVHDYGAVCQSVTDLAVETETIISVEDFRTLNRCLDDAIAGAVASYGRHQRTDESLNQNMTLRNLIETALQAFEVLRSGTVGAEGATGQLLHRCLRSMLEITPILK